MAVTSRVVLGDSLITNRRNYLGWQGPLLPRGVQLGLGGSVYQPTGPVGYIDNNGVSLPADGRDLLYSLENGDSPDVLLNIPQYLRSVRFLESFDSISSVGWYAKKSVRIAFSPAYRQKIRHNAPVRPVYLPPMRRRLKAPVLRLVRGVNPPRPTGRPKLDQRRLRRFNALVAKLQARYKRLYEVKMERFLALKEKRKAMIIRYDAIYKRRLEKYHRRLALYDARVAKLAAGKKLTYRVVNPSVTPLEQHPYMRTRVWFPKDSPLVFGNLKWSNHLAGLSQEEASLQSFAMWASDQRVTATPLNNTALSARLLTGGAHLEQVFSSELTRLDALVKNKLVEKVSNQKVNLVFMTAERGQTFSLVRDIVKRLSLVLRGKRKLLHSLGKYAKKSPRRIADDFLAFEFGVLPLMSDLAALKDKLLGPSETSLTFRSNSTTNLEDYVVLLGRRVRVKASISVSVVLRYQMDNSATRALSEFGFINPAEVAWETMPWSFVVDWFVPVGNWISSFTAESGLTRLPSTRTVRIFLTVLDQGISNGLSNADYFDALSSMCSKLGLSSFNGDVPYVDFVVDGCSIEYKRRTVLSDEYSLVFNPIAVTKNPVSWTHGFESLALLVQRLLKP